MNETPNQFVMLIPLLIIVLLGAYLYFKAKGVTNINELLTVLWNLLGFKWWLVLLVLMYIVDGLKKMGGTDDELFPFALLTIALLLFCSYGTYRRLRGKAATGTIPMEFKGVFFGVYQRRLVGKPIDRDGHILVVGGAGSGKSACIAIPTLRDYWEGRFLAVDIKGELARKSGRQACIFNPADPGAFGYDPFYLARKENNPVSPIRDVVLAIVPTPPALKDPFWVQAAQNILTGHLLASFKQGDSFIEAVESLQSIPAQNLLEVDSEDEQARRYLIQYMGTKPETLASIMSELSNHVMPFATDPQLQTALAARKIITPDLLEQGSSIFLQIPENRINQWKALITLILQQFLSHFEQRPEGNNVPVLFLLDEFARFGKLEGIVHGLATLRSKKITICIMVQSLAQLDAIYGAEQRRIIADNCSYKAVLSATDADTQKYFSSLVGTEMQEQRSFTRTGLLMGNVTISSVERAAIKPEDFAYLKTELVLLTPDGYGKVHKVYC